VHPGIRKGIEREIARARSAGQVEVILLDAAVLFEAGWNDLCNAVFYVHVPDEVRLERVTRTRGWDEAELKKREASQWSLADKQSRADGVVDNSGSLEEAGAQLERLVRQLIHDSSPPSNE